MPSATNALPLSDVPMISVIGGRAFVDGDPLDELGDGTETARLLRTTMLLRSRRENWALLQPSKPFPGRVVLQIDRDAPAYQVKRLVASASAAGIYAVDFMVVQR
ncbi:MAG: hypothetical protein JNK04_26505 [Myxococcales bacterium]|nr:hypothetical protein [Myxococcales bacterium]